MTTMKQIGSLGPREIADDIAEGKIGELAPAATHTPEHAFRMTVEHVARIAPDKRNFIVVVARLFEKDLKNGKTITADYKGEEVKITEKTANVTRQIMEAEKRLNAHTVRRHGTFLACSNYGTPARYGKFY